MSTDAALYSIAAGNSILIDSLTIIHIDSVVGGSVALSSRTTTSIKMLDDVIRWIDQGRAVVSEGS